MIFALKGGKPIIKNGKLSCLCCESFPNPDLDIIIATATSAGGGLGCVMGPVVKTFETPPPYTLYPGSYQLRVSFTTGDNLYHKDCYYALVLSFSPVSPTIAWSLTHSGQLGGNPWVVTNSGKNVRFNVEDDADFCGGLNGNIQTGLATAIITVGATTQMGFDFDGIAELQDTGYENITFSLRNL